MTHKNDFENLENLRDEKINFIWREKIFPNFEYYFDITSKYFEIKDNHKEFNPIELFFNKIFSCSNRIKSIDETTDVMGLYKLGIPPQ